MTLTIQFDRVAGHATFGPFRMHGDDAFFDICRLLTDRGWWDEPAVFVDERGMVCLTTKSLHACARRYRPKDEAERAANKARAERERLAWHQRPHRGTQR